MKLGELFVDLTFKNDKALGVLNSTEAKFLLFKSTVTGILDTFDQVAGRTLDTAVEFDNLSKVTGFNIQTMQRWKAVAEQNNVAFGDVVGSLEALQKASAEIRLGGGNIAPFQMLGIDPNQDPFALLEQIRKKTAKLDAGTARMILGQFGISENMLVLFKSTNTELDGLNSKLILTEKQTESLLGLNRAWVQLKQTMTGETNRLIADYAESFKVLFKTIIDLIAAFDQFQYRGVVLGGIFTMLAVKLSPMTVALTLAALAFQDLWVAMRGGESYSGKMIEWLEKAVQRFDGLAKATTLWGAAIDVIAAPLIAIEKAFEALFLAYMNITELGTMEGLKRTFEQMQAGNVGDILKQPIVGAGAGAGSSGPLPDIFGGNAPPAPAGDKMAKDILGGKVDQAFIDKMINEVVSKGGGNTVNIEQTINSSADAKQVADQANKGIKESINTSGMLFMGAY